MSQRIREDVLKHLSKSPDDTTGVRSQVSGSRGEIIAALQKLSAEKLIHDVRKSPTGVAIWALTAAGLAELEKTK